MPHRTYSHGVSNCEVAQGLLDIVSWGDGIMGYREGSSLLRIVSVIWMVICVLCIIMLMWLSSLGQSVEQYRADFGSDTVDYVRFMQKNAGILYLDYLFQIFVGVVGYRAGQRNGENTLAFVLGRVFLVIRLLSLLSDFTILTFFFAFLAALYVYGVYETRQNNGYQAGGW